MKFLMEGCMWKKGCFLLIAFVKTLLANDFDQVQCCSDPKNQLSARRNIFVNNVSPMGGNGTFAHPYNTLASAQANSSIGDTIFVLAGDRTTKGMDEGIILKDDQKLIGSGLPLITNSRGNGIELANNNEVSGIHLNATAGWSIHGSSITKAVLTDNLITNPLSLGGIGLFDCSNRINIENCTIQNGSDSDSAVRIETYNTTSATVTIQDNIITDFFVGVAIHSFDNSAISSRVSFNDLSNATSNGINVGVSDLSHSATVINGNSIHDNLGIGMIFSADTSKLTTSSAILHSTIQNNRVINSGSEGIAITTNKGAQQIAHVIGNTLIGNKGSAGLLVETSNSSSLGDFLHLRLKYNDSDTGFFMRNFKGCTFNQEPLVGNVGTVKTSGIITDVPAGNCS